ncbi:hypothetical protein [Burkholderia vietnamiensis]|uniref:hypothetical protein n=1 Tax=Burkholderia vietnamiensis TaxID=60552 RepID=UPI001D142B92|nr:hypothetical protein [Burkholderia vietnamiensis]UEC05516.1 hypothetical protein LK462_35500 [Burkholderia vietnamiensis]
MVTQDPFRIDFPIESVPITYFSFSFHLLRPAMKVHRVTPAYWVELGLDVSDIDAIVELISQWGPDAVIIGGFDQETAGIIADRLVALGIPDVHVEGSGLPSWPTPQSIYGDLMDRLRSGCC